MDLMMLIRNKGWVMLLAGGVFALFPQLAIDALGGTLGDAGALITRLLGLVFLAMGWSMAFEMSEPPKRRESLVYAASDVVAVVLICAATMQGVLNGLGYALAGVYLVSAASFAFCATKG